MTHPAVELNANFTASLFLAGSPRLRLHLFQTTITNALNPNSFPIFLTGEAFGFVVYF